MAAPAPLSTREEELQAIKKTEVGTEIHINSKQQTLGGVQFPLTESAKQAIADMARGSYDYVQLRIGMWNLKTFQNTRRNPDFFLLLDIPAETIHLVCAENISLGQLAANVPSDTPRYHLYKFKHTHEGDYTESIGNTKSISNLPRLAHKT